MKKRDLFFIGVLLVGATIAFLLTKNDDPIDKVTPCKLLDIASTNDKYISTDELARMMMSNDPTVVLIDLRTKVEFDTFSLSGAINIPIDSILNPQYEEVINQNIFTNIFYSNSSDMAAKVWLITQRLGYKNNYILRGGLNRWVETILRPRRPLETAVNTDFELYNSRRAASAYFGGGTVNASSTIGDKPSSTPFKRRKKEAAGGGCD